MNRDEANDGKVCTGDNRVFELKKMRFSPVKPTKAKCDEACQQDYKCVGYTAEFNSWCIGCSGPFNGSSKFAKAYKKTDSPKKQEPNKQEPNKQEPKKQEPKKQEPKK